MTEEDIIIENAEVEERKGKKFLKYRGAIPLPDKEDSIKIQTAKKIGPSSHVTLPKSWRGEKVLAIKVSALEEKND